MFKRYLFNADQLFDINVVPSLAGMPSQANLSVSKKTNTPKGLSQGCGIYFILHKSKLIYLGKFLGTKSDAFAGDLFNARWCRHMSTLPMRGSRISVGAKLVRAFAAEQPTHLLTSVLTSVSPVVLGADRGFVVPFNRLKFVALNWASFSKHHDSWIGDFRFGYLQLDPTYWTSHTTAQVRSTVSQVEKEVIEKYKPVCNVESTFAPDLIVECDIESLFEDLEAVFKQGKEDDKTESLIEENSTELVKVANELTSDGYGENFMESIPQDCPQETVDAIKSAFGADSSVEIHHTKTKGGDFRIRALNGSPRRNVFTMFWKVTKDVFLCRIYLPLNQVNGPGIINATHSPENEPLMTTFEFDCTQSGSIANLIELIRQAVHAAE